MLYLNARNRALQGMLWSALSRRSRRLLSLVEVDGACEVRSRRHAGIRAVPICRIRGSESRCDDFDRDFNPLQGRTAGRWQSVARARQQGRSLPPVDLVQVGDVYFVRDGHHRISVARALGQLDIEAEVTVWQVAGQLPWERAAAKRSSATDATKLGRLFERMRQLSPVGAASQ